MTRGALIFAAVLLGLTTFSVWASRTGFGLPQPARQPPSLREGSQRIGSAGHYRTRYFIGGGIHRGK